MKIKLFSFLAVMLMALTANAQHEYVDLGLPSGTLWATCNVGANSPEKVGARLAWSKNDVATANWGSEWQMPTNSQWKELINKKYTSSEMTTLNGVEGLKITGKNGNSIFLPEGEYWTSDTWEDDVITWIIDSDNPYLIDNRTEDPDYNCHIRPVRVQGPKYTISNIPDGWKVNGSTTSGTYNAEEGRTVVFTPANIPAGKKIKSIKAVKK